MATSASKNPSVGAEVPSLKLPHSQFARVHPHGFLLSHLASGEKPKNSSVRANGRSSFEFRNTEIDVGALTHTHGSSTVRIGDTLAVCGIRAEQLYTSDLGTWNITHSSPTFNDDENDKPEDPAEKDDPRHISENCLLVPNVSLNTGCAPGFIPGGPPSPFAQALSHQILSLLTSSRVVRAEDLRIWYQHPDSEPTNEDTPNETEEMDVDGEKADDDTATREIMGFWVLYIDVMILSSGGSIFDAAWAAVIAALSNVTLPNAWWDAERELIICSDEVEEARKLSLRSVPISSSFAVFEADEAATWRSQVTQKPEEIEIDEKGRWIMADPDGYEEHLAKERVNIVVHKDKEGKTIIHRLEKIGGYTIQNTHLRRLVGVASDRWDQVMKIFPN